MAIGGSENHEFMVLTENGEDTVLRCDSCDYAANAERAEKNMIASYGAARAVLRAGEQPVWRILAGRETSPEAAELLAKRIRSEQHEPQAFVVRLDP